MSGTASAGQAAQSTLAVTPRNGFSGNVSFACSGLPAGAICSFSPATLAVSGSAAINSTLTIGTTTRTAMSGKGEAPSLLDPRWRPGGLLLAGLGLPLALCRRRRRATERFMQRSALVLFLLGGATLLHGCGGGGGAGDSNGAGPGGGASGGTPAGNYTITITATGGSAAHAVTYALTVN